MAYEPSPKVGTIPKCRDHAPLSKRRERVAFNGDGIAFLFAPVGALLKPIPAMTTMVSPKYVILSPSFLGLPSAKNSYPKPFKSRAV